MIPFWVRFRIPTSEQPDLMQFARKSFPTGIMAESWHNPGAKPFPSTAMKRIKAKTAG